ncbi:Opacity protein [Loktanella atrilutea]|uniref:Opacity protein n=1 Tax=Loktanella atrilutea TaxID=366533 RepID=A0A1M4TJ08_LOKAT|nr:outer membrane beta-barrel protein [Loktanella atrilutea]SHE44450.1 Opacity protein [Loktanella atrilutea]
MKNVMILGAVVAMATASAATAGGMAAPVVEPAPAPVITPMAPMSSDWSGFYLGAQAGAGKAELDGTFGGAALADQDLNNYGVHAGYLYDLGSFVLGGELAYDKLDVDTIGDNNDVVRAGVLAGYDAGRFMPYLAGGYAYLDTDAFGTSENDNGYYYGVGATYAVTPKIRVGVEYLEHKFDDFNDTGVDLTAKTTSLKASFAF